MASLLQVLLEDWSVNDSVLERAVVLTYRCRHWGLTRSPRLPWALLGIALRPVELLLRIMIGGQINARAEIGRRLRIPHAWGIVIRPSVRMGDGCRVYHQVTLGVNEHAAASKTMGPCIGDRVYIGAGAKVIGPLSIGNDVTIGANAVVLKDVPDDHVAVGVPAAIKPRRH